MNQEKRITIFNKETGMLVRTTVSKSLELKEEGYTTTTKSKLHSFLNKNIKLQRNLKTLENNGIEINPSSGKHRYIKMPSGNICIVLSKRHIHQLLVVHFA